MNKLCEVFPGAKLDIARMTPISAGVPAPTNHTAGVTGSGVMKRGSMKKLSSFLVCATFTLCPAIAAPPKTVDLGSAASFAVLGGSGVTDTGDTLASPTVIKGNLGLYPADGTAITGFTGENGAACCGVVNGTIYDTGSGESVKESNAAAHAAASLGIAIGDANGRQCPASQTPPGCVLAGELSGLTITPGVYKNSGVVTVSGPVYLSGDGVYIFQIAGGLIVNTGGTVILEKRAKAANVFWVTTQATLGSSDKFEGNILSTTSITFTATAGGTALTGRALAQTVVSFAAADKVTLP
jgi:hypothetical protein